MKKYKRVQWKEICEPITCGYADMELRLAAMDRMLETSRKYLKMGRWGTYGVTGTLLDSSCVNMERESWICLGNWDEFKEKVYRTIIIGMLTSFHHASTWRNENNISPDKRVVLNGPFDEDNRIIKYWWGRLHALTDSDIISLNKRHPKATRLSFKGFSIKPYRNGKRTWLLDYFVQYPNEKYGSGWDLSFLMGMDNENLFIRQETETTSEFFERIVHIVEKLKGENLK